MPTSRFERIKRGGIGESTRSGDDAILVYRVERKRKKKGTRGLRIFEKILRRGASANETMASDYLERHKRSSGKRRDGWLRDFPVNVFRAQQKSLKRLKLGGLFF
jgi:hypothetical protein